MEQTIIIELMKWGGGVIILYLVILLIKALSDLLSKRNNGNSKDIKDLKNKVNNEFSHELQDIRADINQIWVEVRGQGKAIAILQTKVDEIKR